MKIDETGRPVTLQIPVEGQQPNMWDKDERKQEYLKWLDNKPCVYGTICLQGDFYLIVSSPDYIIREWIEKFYIPISKSILTVDEVIDFFEFQDRFDPENRDKIEKIIKKFEDNEDDDDLQY